jgi:response regulator RpfG family c-di-GMP phosphodiesterase
MKTKIDILKNIKELNIIFVVDKNYLCKRFEQTKVLLQRAVNEISIFYDYESPYKFFLENQNSIDLILILSNIDNNKAFSFLSHIKKISLDIPFLIIGEKSTKHLEAMNYIQKPLNQKELLEKIHYLCVINHFVIDEFINESKVEFEVQRTTLSLSKDDLLDISLLVDDYENIVAELLYSKDIEKSLSSKDIHTLLQRTYNTFYTFIDEDIKDAIEPFSIILISFANTMSKISFKEHGSKEAYEILVLVLEDILKFIEDTVKKEQYIHSQYLLDSFISNIDYLKVAFNLIKVEENEEQLEFF